MRTKGRRWRDLSQGHRTAIVTIGIVEALTTAVAAADLSRRPRSQVRGPKALWWLAFLVQPVGPVAYLAVGRSETAGADPAPVQSSSGWPVSA